MQWKYKINAENKRTKVTDNDDNHATLILKITQEFLIII